MEALIIGLVLATVVAFYFRHNPISHSSRFIFRRFVNWFPLGMTYAFLYMARYNLSVSKNALGNAMTKEDFGLIFGAGTFVYGLSFLLNGPLVDKFGGKRGIIVASAGACLANIAMGLALYFYMHGLLHLNLTLVFGLLYSLNMYFQSYGAVSIIKVKAYWFHVRERGVFGAIFGTLISVGVYFAFDWGQAIVDAARVQFTGEPGMLRRAFELMFAVNTNSVDSIWLVFFIPAVILAFWCLLDHWLIRNSPGEAGHEDFDTHDASSGEMDREFTMGELLRRILSNRLLLTFAMIEFTTGVVRNGVMQWYFVFAKEIPQVGAEYISLHWGFLVCVFGIAGGFLGGFISDHYFQSRRAPPTAISQGLILGSTIVMIFSVHSSPILTGICCLIIACLVISTHSLMSGTAAADFGGRKATATASGILDGFVYLGSGLQSISLGYLTSHDWVYWPIFLSPFAFIGMALALRTWRELPEATKRYLIHVEKIEIISTSRRTIIMNEKADLTT